MEQRLNTAKQFMLFSTLVSSNVVYLFNFQETALSGENRKKNFQLQKSSVVLNVVCLVTYVI